MTFKRPELSNGSGVGVLSQPIPQQSAVLAADSA
jgi:hypothetical protein